MRILSNILIIAILLTVNAVFANNRDGIVTIKINLPSEKGSIGAKLWLPYPLSGEYQTIENMSVSGTYADSSIYREPVNGAIYQFAHWNAASGERMLEMKFKVSARERGVSGLSDIGAPIPKEVEKYLESSKWIPTDGKVKEIANQITNEDDSILIKSRAVYDWVVENTYRDPNVKGCGFGIVAHTLKNRGGKCVDISSEYVAIARAAGVPAREIFGLRLGKKDKQNMTGGYHCWAEFYLPGTGWVAVDPADVRKMMLVKNLNLVEASKYREYFFGGVDEFRIVLEVGGRGVNLYPQQKGNPLNYFMYPYAEIDGVAADYFEPKSFSYSVEFEEIK